MHKEEDEMWGIETVRKDGETWGEAVRKHIRWNTFVSHIFIYYSLMFQFKIYDYGNESSTCPCG